jgi:cytochrome c553
MKTTSITTLMLTGLVLAACARHGGTGADSSGAGAGQGGPQAGAAQHMVPEPGAQPEQAGIMQQQNASGGPAQAFGQPGAAAAQAVGPAQLQTGQQIAAQGTPNGVTACVGCHGAQGEGNAAGGFPRIAGQSSYYLGKQLAAYANEARVNPIMQPIAKAMNAEQIRDVSAYYATLGAAPGNISTSDAKAAGSAKGAAKGAAKGDAGAARALQLASAGDNSKGVQACANCHGPGGAGEPPVYPYLAGQHPNYLTAAMQQWKSGARKTDPSDHMVRIAKALSDADVGALSAYFGAQPAPPAAAKLVNIAAGSAQRPAVAAAPGAPGPRAPGGAGVTGSGTEQGAPTTGGGQGPGGGGATQGTKPPEPPVRR